MTYPRDAAGRASGYTFQGGQTSLSATYGYSATTGQLTTVTSGARPVTYTYDTNTGWLSQTANPPLLTVRSPDEQGRLHSIASYKGGSPNAPVLSSSTYTYDAASSRPGKMARLGSTATMAAAK